MFHHAPLNKFIVNLLATNAAEIANRFQPKHLKRVSFSLPIFSWWLISTQWTMSPVKSARVSSWAAFDNFPVKRRTRDVNYGEVMAPTLGPKS